MIKGIKEFSSPLGEFVFYILSLAVSINTKLKTRYSAENIIEDIYWVWNIKNMLKTQ